MKAWQSISVRLVGLIALLLLLALAGFGSLAWLRESAARMAAVDRELEVRLNLLISGYRPGPGQRLEEVRDPQLSPRARMLFANDGSVPFHYLVWRSDGVLQGGSANAPEIRFPKGSPRERKIGSRGEFRELMQFTESGRCFLVGRSVQLEREAMRRDALTLGAAGGGILMLGIGAAWWIASGVTRPLRTVGKAAREIAAGDLSRRIPRFGREDEIGDVAQILNESFARLEQAFERQKQFTADASHELRTPVSLILTHAQGALLREQTPEDYREALADCEQAASRMKSLIESLLDLARIESAPAIMEHKMCDLAEIVRDCARQFQPLSQEKSLRLEADLASAPCIGDSSRLTQVVSNLLINAIQHSPAGGIVTVRTSAGNEACLAIANGGPGIPPDELPRLFERFHRGDKSRARATGGTGLGLAISKAIVDAHKGRITVDSGENKATMVCVWLPNSGRK